MAAFTASQASVTNGSKVVTINSGENTANIRQGDFLVLGTFAPVEILRGYVSTGGVQSLELIKAWDSGNQSNQKAIVIPTTVEVRTAVTALQNANTLVNDNFAAMQDWQTKTGTVTFTNQDGTTSTIKTLKQMENEANAQLAEYHPYPWAMRKVEFEARRAANNEKFAASGFVYKGKSHNGDGYTKVAEGLWTNELSPNVLRLGRVGGEGKSESDNPVINIAGYVTKLENLGTGGSLFGAEVKLPPPEEGKRTYDRVTGLSVLHATPAVAFASETATNKVVTEPVDMWGFEGFLREISDTDPFVYKYGLIQSLATNINGVPTVYDNMHPHTYFAWYKGDQASRGKGVNWQTATETQRQVIASDPENNIYFDDATGKFYQWSPRGRSFRGLDNGDWASIDTVENNYLRNTQQQLIIPQGKLEANDVTALNKAMYIGFGNKTIAVHTKDQGVFSTRTLNDGGISYPFDISDNGECHFLVCGTINRLNRGAWHPSLQPKGASPLTRYNSTPQVNGYYKLFDTPDAPTNANRPDFNTKADAFNLTSDWTKCCGEGPNILANGFYGSILSGDNTKSGRPDGRFCDVIYASGYGGVCRDMRYSAWGLNDADFYDNDLAIKSGEYRGRENPSFVKVGTVTNSAQSVYSGGVTKLITAGQRYSAEFEEWDGYDVSSVGINAGIYGCYIVDANGSLHSLQACSIRINSDAICYILGNQVANFPAGTYSIVITRNDLKFSSISGEYTHAEVVGDPNNILLCDELRNGWLGSWNPTIPDGSTDYFQFTKPYSGAGTDIQRTHTFNSGAAWTEESIFLSDTAINSTIYTNMPTNQVAIYQYKTKAKMTTDSVKSDIYGKHGAVYFGSRCLDVAGRSLAFSLISKIITDSQANVLSYGSLMLSGFSIFDGQLLSSRGGLTHQELPLAAPNNDSVAFKALDYNVNNNQQGFINYAYTELQHNGTDWGDDGNIHLVHNQTIMLDENGNTVLVGTAQCVEPLGWIKNDK